VSEILGVMVESCAPSGCRACSVRSPCTCRSRTVGILEIAGIQAPVRGLLSGARTICSIPSGKSQCVEGGVIFADWWSRQCAFKLSVLTHVGHSPLQASLWDNLLRRYLCPVSRLCRPASIGLAVIAQSRGIESPVLTGVHTLAWTAR